MNKKENNSVPNVQGSAAQSAAPACSPCFDSVVEAASQATGRSIEDCQAGLKSIIQGSEAAIASASILTLEEAVNRAQDSSRKLRDQLQHLERVLNAREEQSQVDDKAPLELDKLPPNSP